MLTPRPYVCDFYKVQLNRTYWPWNNGICCLPRGFVATLAVPTVFMQCAVHGSVSTVKYCSVSLQCSRLPLQCSRLPLQCSARRCNIFSPPLQCSSSFRHCIIHGGVSNSKYYTLTQSTVCRCNVLAPVATLLFAVQLFLLQRPSSPSAQHPLQCNSVSRCHSTFVYHCNTARSSATAFSSAIATSFGLPF